MKIIVILVAVGIIALTTFFIFLNENQRWVIINGDVAESYAESLLKKDVKVKIPDQFIDYSVSSSDGYVVFSRHSDHDRVYGYFPDKNPSEIGDDISNLDWKSLGDSWFVSQ